MPEDGRALFQSRHTMRGGGDGPGRREDFLDLGFRIRIPDHIAPETGASERDSDRSVAYRHALHGTQGDSGQAGAGRFEPFEQQATVAAGTVRGTAGDADIDGDGMRRTVFAALRRRISAHALAVASLVPVRFQTKPATLPVSAQVTACTTSDADAKCPESSDGTLLV